MRAVEELPELIEAHASLQWLALAILDALQLQFQRLGGHVAQPEDHLQGLALYLTQWNRQDMIMLLLVRSKFLVESVRVDYRGIWIVFFGPQPNATHPVILKLSQ